MRNILIHRYKDIDDKIVFDSIPKLIQDTSEYIQTILPRLDSL